MDTAFLPECCRPAPTGNRNRRMNVQADSPITALLSRWKDGDRSVENQLATLIYPVLRDIARGQMRRSAGVLTLRPTELVNEAYERIAAQKDVPWQNRAHFYAIAATLLRRVLIDHIRQRMTEKHGGDVRFVALDHPDSQSFAGPGDLIDWLALDQSLTRLGEAHPAAGKVVELRLFSGLAIEQIAEACTLSTATVGRHWRFARAWLSADLGDTAQAVTSDA
jgi:RNA polymerase sigma factor (TIGR02999 family)